jgi:hypothetical protein
MLAALGNVNPSHLYDTRLQASSAEAAPDEDVVPLRRIGQR